MLVTYGESYTLELFRRKENSAYEYEEEPYITFKCRPAGSKEKKEYRLQKGVIANNDSIYLIATNMPTEIKPNDRVRFLGEEKTVSSIGYYFDSSRIVNASILSEEAIMNRCPKGLTIQ